MGSVLSLPELSHEVKIKYPADKIENMTWDFKWRVYQFVEILLMMINDKTGMICMDMFKKALIKTIAEGKRAEEIKSEFIKVE